MLSYRPPTQIKEEMNSEDLRRWIWIRCPFCSSKALPTVSSEDVEGDYQEDIVLKCPRCGKSIQFITDWDPIVDFSPVNEIPNVIQGAICPYLSIQKKKEYVVMLHCCSRSCRACFGRIPETCYSYRYSKLREYFESNDYEKAVVEAEAAIALWKKEYPDEVPPNGTHELIEIKHRILSETDWIKWVNDQIVRAEEIEDLSRFVR
jgi:hypothetical protein